MERATSMNEGSISDDPRHHKICSKDSPPRRSTMLLSPIPNIKSPEAKNLDQSRDYDSNEEESRLFQDSPFLIRALDYNDGDKRGPSSSVNTDTAEKHLLWKDDSGECHMSTGSNDDEQHKQAVEEAQLQAQFAQQTAREMSQVMDWWRRDSVTSQSISLKDNSLVYASASHDSSDDLDDDKDLFTTPHKTIPIQDTNGDTCCISLEELLSPIVPVESPQRLAKEQSFAVDDVCSKANRMKDILKAALNETVENDNDQGNENTQTFAEPRQCRLNDLPWMDRLVVIAKCSSQQRAMRFQQWLYHVLPPSFISFWLRHSWRHRLVLLLVLGLFALYATVLWNDLLSMEPTTALVPTCQADELLDSHGDEVDYNHEFHVHYVLL